ncbi:MAG: hypothetical protein IID45_14170, partial [Planctomycetes bacterium]|nr:hypothetical protein [Planctomycetota bacterium]
MNDPFRARLQFRIGNICVSLRSDVDDAVDDFIALYEDYRQAHSPGDRVIEMEVRTAGRRPWRRRRFAIWGDGERIFQNRRRDEILPYLEWGINRRIMCTRLEYVQVHAASLVRHGKGVIIAGDSGRGKSTLAAGLLARGWKYCCDEFALIDPDTLVNRDAEGETLSLAPISLGNPTTAAKLTTRRRETPRNGAPGALQGAFTGAVTALPDLKVPLRVGRGDTLAGMLTGAGVSAADAQGAISALSKHFNPRRIKRGQTVAVLFAPPAVGSPEADRPEPGKFLGFVVEPDYDTVIRVEKTAEGAFNAAKIKKTLTQAPARAGGVIRTSLYVAGRKAGIPRRVLAELIRAYSWDVDFQRDIRAGDRFEVMYERFFDTQGLLVYSGPILYAALT